VSTRRDHDRLAKFSHLLAQIKFIILEIVIFIGFLLWLVDKIKHDFHISFGAAPTAELSTTAPSDLRRLPIPRQPSRENRIPHLMNLG